MYGKLYIGDKGYIPCLEVNKDGNPVGTVITFAGTTAPKGYLLCDGREVSRTVYSDLFSVIGTTYGPGDGSSSFNLPDETLDEKLIDYKLPYYDNGYYYWYKLYTNGWVEQGGSIPIVSMGFGQGPVITFPIPMADVNYIVTISDWGSGSGDFADQFARVHSKTTSTLGTYFNWAGSDKYTVDKGIMWRVTGLCSIVSPYTNQKYIKY